MTESVVSLLLKKLKENEVMERKLASTYGFPVIQKIWTFNYKEQSLIQSTSHTRLFYSSFALMVVPNRNLTMGTF